MGSLRPRRDGSINHCQISCTKMSKSLRPSGQKEQEREGDHETCTNLNHPLREGPTEKMFDREYLS